MIIDITRKTLEQVKNPRLAAYASLYLDIYDRFMGQVRSTGIEIDACDYAPETTARLERLKQKGAHFRNDGKSIYLNTISPACVACQTGIGSTTFFLSLKCHRDCFYCFNPNQEEYDYFSKHQRNVIQELDEISSRGAQVKHLALTGGEPLLFKAEAVEFYRHAGDKFPAAHKRLYTSGDHIDAKLLNELKEAGLDEIRFSIRMSDLEKGHRHTFDRIALAKEYIGDVMVEMPVLPDTLGTMQEVLLELDRLNVSSINLLEFCFPWNNVAAFNAKSYKVKAQPYRIPYNYWYAGGLPIARSELECLDLMEFALDKKLKLGVHYCSLENKHTGQIYQQNLGSELPRTTYFSQKDYFLKSAKVFGTDVPKVTRVLNRTRGPRATRNEEYGYVEFHVEQIPALSDLDIEIGISSSVMETREDGQYLRELKLDLTTPQQFDLARDV